jgi:uncharacterized protein DUF6962
MIGEPVTVLTDYLLAGVTGWLGWRLFRAREDQAARSGWALAFVALAAAALLGGSHHGFSSVLPDVARIVLWKTTLLAVGVASFGMVAGSAIAVTAGRVRKALVSLAAVKLAAYSAWMLMHDAFIYVIADTGIAMAVVAALHVWSAMREENRASLWMLGGVGVSVLAAAAQASGYAPHRHFNHNDLYHVVQVAAMAMFYVGAKRLRDSSR